MSRTRLKADNAEQLAEIIKAIQRGEEPTQESIRRNTESAPQADSPMSSPEKGDSDSSFSEEKGETGFAIKWPSLKRQMTETKPERPTQESEHGKQQSLTGQPEMQKAEETQEAEETQDPEDEEEWEGFSPTEFAQSVTERLQGIRNLVQRKKGTSFRKQESKEKSSTEKKAAGEAETREKVAETKEKVAETKEKTAEKLQTPQNITLPGSLNEQRRNSFSDMEGRDWESLDDADDDFDGGLFRRKRIRLTDTMEENERFHPSKWSRRRGESSEEEAESKIVLQSDGREAEEERQEEAEKSAKQPDLKAEKEHGLTALFGGIRLKRKAKKEEELDDSEEPDDSEELDASEEQDDLKEPNDSEQLDDSEKLATSRKLGDLEDLDASKKQDDSEELDASKAPDARTTRTYKLRKLQDAGIGGHELLMIAAGIVLVLLVVFFVGRMISGRIADSRKSQNVTEDKGLYVTVEEEPSSWSSSWPVKMKFKASGATITEIRINGETCMADDRGIVTYDAHDWELMAEVDTDKNTTLQAKIEIPMLDGEAPAVHAVRKQDQIELTATDDRSTVTGIYYAAVEENAFMDMPEYQKYSEAIPFEENTMYYFYAEDAAGNCSVPVVTNMKAATELVLDQKNIHLYPGESGEVMAEARPAGALLENLQYESQNPDILSVSENGMVTALGEGTGSIKVSADGVQDVTCTVTVSKEKTVTISTLGDCTLGTDANFSTVNSFNAYDTANGHDYFFRNVKSILEEDDVTFANLEGTFTTSNARADKQYAFKGDPDYTEILTDGSVEVVTLANNHSADYGEQGLADTKAALEGAGIDYCIGDTIAIKEVNGVKIAFIGIFVNYGTDDSENQLRADIEDAKKQGAELIITAFHWGSEKATQPDETQQFLAHTAIDCGADLVVGHHPHVLQGIEQYHGKYIAYSLGNFCFGGNSNPSDMDTMIFRQTFTISSNGTENGGVSVVPCSISSEQGYNNYQPTPAEGTAAQEIITRLNEYSASYGVTVAEDGSVNGNSADDSLENAA